MERLADLSALKNLYLIIRHGQSEANQQGLIVSSPENGVESYGLTELGRTQVKQSVSKHLQQSPIPTHIINSDFKRAKETAEIAQQLFACPQPLTYSPLIRERFFGDLELTQHDNYQLVWDADKLNTSPPPHQAESTDTVLARMKSMLDTLEDQFEGEVILLVSHGDPLQILLTAFEGVPLSEHRSLPHLETAEIRMLNKR